MEIVNLKDLKNQVISGIYKLDFPNGKSYIGQAKNIYKRVSEHNNYAQYGHSSHKLQVCEKAIQKYGQISNFIILERITNFKILDNRESYWINYYNTTNRNYGYNIEKLGNASGKSGCDNKNAAFNEKQLAEIIDLLINHEELSLIDIANKYNVTQNTILRISTGKSYINSNLNYPLRKNNHASQKKIEILDYFQSETDLLKLKDDLKYRWDLTIEVDLIKKYNIPLQILRDINNGRKFNEIGNYTYPIRSKNVRNNNNFIQQDILDILDLLKNTKMTMTEIGNQYNIGRAAVANINKGKTYIIKDYNYPARKI